MIKPRDDTVLSEATFIFVLFPVFPVWTERLKRIDHRYKRRFNWGLPPYGVAGMPVAFGISFLKAFSISLKNRLKPL